MAESDAALLAAVNDTNKQLVRVVTHIETQTEAITELLRRGERVGGATPAEAAGPTWSLFITIMTAGFLLGGVMLSVSLGRMTEVTARVRSLESGYHNWTVAHGIVGAQHAERIDMNHALALGLHPDVRAPAWPPTLKPPIPQP